VARGERPRDHRPSGHTSPIHLTNHRRHISMLQRRPENRWYGTISRRMGHQQRGTDLSPRRLHLQPAVLWTDLWTKRGATAAIGWDAARWLGPTI